jgi:hypothetical protein
VSGFALKQLQEQIEAVRIEAYREGYDAAMSSIVEFAQTVRPNHPVPPRHEGTASKLNDNSAMEIETSGNRPRGYNRKLVLDILRPITPRSAGPTSLMKLIKQSTGLTLNYSSVRNALRQLEGDNIVEEVDDTKTWRFIPPPDTAGSSPDVVSDDPA